MKPCIFTHSVCLCASYNSRNRGCDAASVVNRITTFRANCFIPVSFLHVSCFWTNRISLLAPKQLDNDTPEGNPTVAQLITRTRTFIVVVTKTGYSSIYSAPTDPPLSRIHHGSQSFLRGTWPQHPQTNICLYLSVIPITPDVHLNYIR